MTARRRATVLLSVLVVIVLAALIGTTMIAVADAHRAETRGGLDRDRLRALAWSGVKSVAAGLASQRDVLLGGGDPDVPESWTVFEDGGERGEITLLELTQGHRAEPEAGKIPVNRADAAMLAKLAALGEAGANSLLGARGDGFESMGEVIEAIGEQVVATPAAESADASASTGTDAARLLGVHSFDPAVAVGAEGGLAAGVRRLRVPAKLDDGARSALQKKFATAATAIEAAASGAGPGAPSRLVEALVAAGVPAKEWSASLDSVAWSDDPFVAGLVDINRASAAVLACLPGLNEDLAGRIESARGSLDAATKRRLTWPLENGIVNADQFKSLVDFIAVRSLQWRVRVEARIAKEGTQSGGRLVLEAVIDVASRRVRIAELRDVTFADVAVAAGKRRAAAKAAAAETAATSIEGPPEPPMEPTPEVDDTIPPDEPPPMIEEPDPAPPAQEEAVGPPAPGRDIRTGRWRPRGH